MAWPTPAQVVSAAARELGLISADVSDPFASTDVNIKQMSSMLNALGQELTRQHDWTQLHVSASFATVVGLDAYALPEGFVRMLDQSLWNGTAQQPLGLVSPQEWVRLNVMTSGGLTNKVARILGRTIKLFETPTAAETINYEYRSKYWARDAVAAWVGATAYVEGNICRNGGLVYTCISTGTSAVSGGPAGTTSPVSDGSVIWAYSYPSVDAAPGTAEASDTASDYLLFDYRLLVTALKLRFRREKGLDTQSQQQDYEAALSAALGGDGAAPVLSLSPASGFPYLGVGNTPEGGYG